MFGISFTEFALIMVVALVVLGPERLPGMLRTVGQWIHKVRRITTEVRAQTGIDDLLRAEGFAGGLTELRSMLRGDPRLLVRPSDDASPIATDDPYESGPMFDVTRERPVEGPDANGALPDDLVDESALGSASAPLPPAPDEPHSDPAGANSTELGQPHPAHDPPVDTNGTNGAPP